MKTERNILIAFILNLAFAIFECFGGILTGSTAITSDALHDLGDAMSIGIAYFFEKKSKKQPDETHPHGYATYSVLSSIFTTSILLFGSVLVICTALSRLRHPTEINYNGMILFAIIGICVNLSAVYFTHGSHSLNQKAVNLHMLEDVLSWAVVLIGAIVMHFTYFCIIDPLLSIGISLFILCHAVHNLKEAVILLHTNTPTEHHHPFRHHHH